MMKETLKKGRKPSKYFWHSCAPFLLRIFTENLPKGAKCSALVFKSRNNVDFYISF